MRTILKMVSLFAIFMLVTSVVDAQDVGNIIKKGKVVVKKGKKAADALFGTEGTISENPSERVIPSISATGTVISNPVNSFIEIEPVGLFGVSKSENFGDAYLVLRVRKLIPNDVTRFGSSIQNQKMIAVDYNGKTYPIDSSGHYQYDTPEGLIVKVVLDEPGLMFTDIKKDINMMQQVKFGVFSDAQHQGNVTITNIPIFWDQVPE